MKTVRIKPVDAIGADGCTVRQRLERLKIEHGLVTYGAFAARCGATENTASEWLKGKSLPGGGHLRGIQKGFNVSIDFVLNGVTEPGAPAEPTIHDAWSSRSPAGIPAVWREDYGSLVDLIGDLLSGSPKFRRRKPSLSDAQQATLCVATAAMSEIRNQRGDRKKSPETLLNELRTYRGPQAHMMYLLWIRLAVTLAIPKRQLTGELAHSPNTIPPSKWRK